MKLDKRQQLLGILAIAAVVLLGGDRLVFTPLIGAWKARAVRLADLKKSVSDGQALLDREPAIRERWDRMRTNTLASEVSAAENQVLKAFDRWSQDSRAGISSIKPQWKQQADEFMVLECRVDAFGSLSALTRFLYEIEKDPLALKVETVEINSRDETGQQLTLGLQVSGLLLTSVKP
jgi:hypothetical protein